VIVTCSRDKKAKLKAMRHELRLYQAKVTEYSLALERSKKDLQLLKLEYFGIYLAYE